MKYCAVNVFNIKISNIQCSECRDSNDPQKLEEQISAADQT